LTTVVLLLLALIWGVLLVSFFRSRATATFSDSVGAFRRNLSVLERATPSVVAPANRLRGPARLSVSSGLAAPSPTFRATLGAGPGGAYTGARTGGPGRAGPRPGPRTAASAASLRRRQAQKRRRDVLYALVAGTAGTALLALIPGLSMLWALQVMFDLMLAGYCSVLIRLRNAAAEREMKLRYMATARPARPVRRPSYDFGAVGYGDLELRRAAN
jgi:hypothetical protein